MTKIVNNYGAERSCVKNQIGKKSYPNLKKYKLKDTITLDSVRSNCLMLPTKNMLKEEIKSWTNEKMELIYV